MKKFRDYLREEVSPTVISNGSVDLENDSVRDEINGILSGITNRSCVTPYTALTKIRKALAYFHIQLPKRAYMEGKHGVEVWEISQFGDKIGFTDQGEWINSVPTKFYLFFHYHLLGSMFSIAAKVVDKSELDKQLDFVERVVSEEIDMEKHDRRIKKLRTDVLEDAEAMKHFQKAVAPKEHMKDIDDSTEGTESAANVTQRTKDKKLSAASLDETRMPASVIKHKQKLAAMSPEEKAKKFAGKSEEQLKSMARRHGYGKDSDEYSKHVKEEEQIDELKKSTVARYEKKAGKQFDKIMDKATDPYLSNLSAAERKTANKRGAGLKMAADRLEETQIDEISSGLKDRYVKKAKIDVWSRAYDAVNPKTSKDKAKSLYNKNQKRLSFIKKVEEETISEKAPPGAKFERMVKHIKKGYSKDGLTTKEKSIAYATAWKAKKREESK